MATSCLVVIAVILQAAAASSPGWCPYEHQLRLLDFGQAVSACSGQLVEESKRASCCRHIASRVAVAAAQYTNSTGLLLSSLPKQHCLDSILSALDAGGVPPAASRSCGAGISLGSAARCGSFHALRAVRELPGFDKLVEACNTPAQCSRCINAAKRFVASLSGRVPSARAPCRDATFLALASAGNASYAMDKATCMFGLEHGQAAECPLELNPWQVQNVASACLLNASNTCCSLSLLTLRIAAAKVSVRASSGQLFIPARQAAACIDRLADSISGLAAAPRAAFVKCGLSAQSIFNDVRRGCNAIATFGELEHALASRGTNWSQVLAACNQRSCAQCRRAGLDAAYAAAWPYFDPATTRSCMDLVFLMLAAASSTTRATQTAACLYALPVFAVGGGDFAFVPAPSPAQWEATISTGGSGITVALAVGSAILGIALAVILLYLLFRQYRRRHWASYTPIWSAKRSASLKQDGSPTFRRFQYSEIRQATDNFTSVIREGSAYKAVFIDGLVVAVTRRPVSERTAKEFVREAELLGRLHHRHLLSLRGFCIHKADEFLVYDYCGIGSSLEEHLHGGAETVLHWRARMDIAVAVASGLEYLHCYSEPPLCHGGIKSGNVLLDGNLVARVANFCAESDELPVYMDDPDYMLAGRCTDKTDVLSFGLLLWELVTGKRCSAKSVRVHGHQLETWRLLLMLDPRIDKSTVNVAEVRNVLEVARLCCLEQSVARPSMKQALCMLLHTSSRRSAPHDAADDGDQTDTSSIDVHSLELAAATAAHGGSGAGGVFDESFRLEGSSPTLSLVSLESD